MTTADRTETVENGVFVVRQCGMTARFPRHFIVRKIAEVTEELATWNDRLNRVDRISEESRQQDDPLPVNIWARVISPEFTLSLADKVAALETQVAELKQKIADMEADS